MTTLSATWEASSGAVLLEVSPTATVTGILRSDANGSLVPVRTAQDALPSSGSLVVRDFEAAQGLVVYRVIDGGAGASASLSVDLGPQARLSAVVLPQRLAVLELVTGYEAGRTAATTIHEVIDRDDPVPSLGPLRSRRGTMDVFCVDYAAALAVVAVYDTAEVVFLRQPFYAGLDMYHVADGAVSVRALIGEGSRDRWQVTIPFVEVRRPADPVRGSIGWTYEMLRSTVASYAAVIEAFETYADLTVGPPA